MGSTTTRPELALLVNPAAGRATDLLTRRARERLEAGGWNVQTLGGADAAATERLAKDAVAAGVQTIVAAGGDGMVNLGLQATATTGARLGIVPAGTGNDIARSLGLDPKNPVAAVDAVLRGRTRRIDLGWAKGRWFASVLSAGFDSAVNERANGMRWPRGQLRYRVAIAAELRTFRALTFELNFDGRISEVDAMLVAVANGPFYGGGIRVCPGADLGDGLLDVMVLRPISKVEFVRVFPQVRSGGHARHPAVSFHRVRHASISASGVTAYADGERLGALPLSAEARPGALEVIVP